MSAFRYVDFEAPMEHRQLEIPGHLSGLDIQILIQS